MYQLEQSKTSHLIVRAGMPITYWMKMHFAIRADGKWTLGVIITIQIDAT